MNRFQRSVYMHVRHEVHVSHKNRTESQGVAFSDETDFSINKFGNAENDFTLSHAAEGEFVSLATRVFQAGKLMICMGDTRTYQVDKIHVQETL